MNDRDLIIIKIDELMGLINRYRISGKRVDRELDSSIIKLNESFKAFSAGPAGEPCPTCGGTGRIKSYY